MSYEAFCTKINNIAKLSGSIASFSKEDGRHIARCSDGVTIVGNSECTNVLVKWGSGHTAHAVI